MNLRTVLTLSSLVLLAANAAAQELRVLTHDSFSLPAELVERFERETGVDVVLLSGGDAGEALNRAILTKGRPIADVLFGVDEGLWQRAADEGVFEPYESPSLAAVPDTYAFDASHLVTPVDVGFVVPNYDVAALAAAGVDPGGLTLADLAGAELAPLTVVTNPATSSPGLAFLFATVAYFGDPQAGVEPAAPAEARGGFADWLDFWGAMAANGVLVADGWSDAYYTAFSRYGGDRPIVLSYATSPAAEVIFAEEPLEESPTANLACEGCAYRQVEGVGVLAGTRVREAAEAFVEFLLSQEAQEAIPLEMFVAPVREGARVPPEFERYATLPAGAVAAPLAPSVVAANQERWLTQWTAVVQQGRDPASVR
ncbi:MAG TPA: thiamine ABC transporter substrate-binding protein [Trueperaceae bacterium]|nr:thiamine ABC transporter substrate-binding protein [Trueperaceae bacterium]